MINKLYSIKDNLLEVFYPTTPCRNDEVAKRWFGKKVIESKDMSYSPKDYDLYYIGTWDDESGTVMSEGKPKIIDKAVNYVNGKNSNMFGIQSAEK